MRKESVNRLRESIMSLRRFPAVLLDGALKYLKHSPPEEQNLNDFIAAPRFGRERTDNDENNRLCPTQKGLRNHRVEDYHRVMSTVTAISHESGASKLYLHKHSAALFSTFSDERFGCVRPFSSERAMYRTFLPRPVRARKKQ